MFERRTHPIRRPIRRYEPIDPCHLLSGRKLTPGGNPPGWQPSRFLTGRAEAERAFALVERLGSVNAAAQQLGASWPSLRKAFTRHGLGMPTPTRSRPPAGRRRRPPDTAASRSPRRWTRCSWPATPMRSRRGRGHRQRSTSGSAATRTRPPWAPRWSSSWTANAGPASPPPRAWAIIRRAERAHRHPIDRQGRGERRRADRAAHSDRTSRSDQPEARGMVADAR
jgi:hypothetical protein